MGCHTPCRVVFILESEERWVTHGGPLLHDTYLTIDHSAISTYNIMYR